MATLLNELAARGMIAQVSDPGLERMLEEERFTVYAGFDPTARSLHLGHMLPIMGLAHFQRAGHRVIVLVGGATGMVGDPSGRSSERNLLSPEQVAENVVCVRGQLSRFLAFDGANPAILADNRDWIAGMSFIDWLRDVGRHFKVSQMLAKESVRKRMESEEGISYTEFSYMTMQAYDFLHLFESHGCRLQAGGSDQWGNITAGIDLVRKVRGEAAYGLTFPLITTAAGEKFGKSAGNAVWLDPELTSPYQLYQYWVRTDDRDAGKYLKYFTFMPLPEIEALCAEHAKAPEKREAQKRLAAEFTRLVHGGQGLARARRATDVLFGAEIEGWTDAELLDIFNDVPSARAPGAALGQGALLVDVLAAAGVFASKGAARRLIQGKGLYLNNRRVDSADARLTPESLASESIAVIRKGRKGYHVVRFE